LLGAPQEFDPTDPLSQSIVMGGAADAAGGAMGRITGLSQQVEQRRAMLTDLQGSDMNGAGGLAQIRQTSGLVQMNKELDAYIVNLQKIRTAGNITDPDDITRLDKLIKGLTDEEAAGKNLVTTLGDVAKAQKAAMAEREFRKQTGELGAEIGDLQGGGTEYSAMIARQARANVASGQDPTKAKTEATTLVQMDAHYKSLTSSAKDFNSAVGTGVNNIVTGFENLITHTKTWKQALGEVAQQMDQLAMNYFINQPIQSMLSNTLNGNPAGMLAGTPYGGGGMGLLGSYIGHDWRQQLVSPWNFWRRELRGWRDGFDANLAAQFLHDRCAVRYAQRRHGRRWRQPALRY
jgi:hypothetical protein